MRLASTATRMAFVDLLAKPVLNLADQASRVPHWFVEAAVHG